MRRIRYVCRPGILLVLLLVAGGLLAGCTVEITSTPAPASSGDGGGQPGVVHAPAGTPVWAELGLTGRLFFVGYDSAQQQAIYELDLVSGALRTLFTAPDNALLNEVAAAPDGQQLAVAYAPPPPEGEIQFGFASIYTMPADGSAAPTPLIARRGETETFYNISWPLADFVYYAHYLPGTGDLGETIYTARVERFYLPDGQPAVLAEASSWPRLSRNGARLAYVTDANELILADADGGNGQVLLPGSAFPAVDAPFFSLEGGQVYVSAAVTGATLTLLDRLLGVRLAEAHSVPSDWWVFPAGGGDGAQLTNLYEVGLYGDLSPDGRHIAFITSGGVFVMNPDGSGVFQLLDMPATGTLNWVP